MLWGFHLSRAMSWLWIDPERRLSEKEAAQFDWVTLALGGLAAYAALHYPMMVHLFDEVFHDS